MRSGQSLPLEQEAGRTHVKVVTGELANAKVTYVNLCTAGKGVDLSTYNHGNDPSPAAPALPSGKPNNQPLQGKC